ncbi:MAG: ECF transporter S component [Treponema sp.]|jgi:uncharacterized membrane protein|nr:ECF transporter S component [Treponema sp.]
MESADRIRKIAAAGVFSALVIVLGVTGLGFIRLPLGALTILQVPVIIGAILEGPLVGIFIGLLFGIFSIVQAAVAGVSPVDLAFLYHPWLAILPRVLIGPAAWFVYSLGSGKFFRGKTGAQADTGDGIDKTRWLRETVAVIAGAAAGSLVNTVLVLSAFVLLDFFPWGVVLSLALLNGSVEAGFSSALSLAVILSWKGISRRTGSKLTGGGPRGKEKKE